MWCQGHQFCRAPLQPATCAAAAASGLSGCCWCGGLSSCCSSEQPRTTTSAASNRPCAPSTCVPANERACGRVRPGHGSASRLRCSAASPRASAATLEWARAADARRGWQRCVRARASHLRSHRRGVLGVAALGALGERDEAEALFASARGIRAGLGFPGRGGKGRGSPRSWAAVVWDLGGVGARQRWATNTVTGAGQRGDLHAVSWPLAGPRGAVTRAGHGRARS